MALDCLVKFKNIPGESQVTDHEDWIECQAFSVGVASSGGNTTELKDFSFTHKIDKASPKLVGACCGDEDLEEVTIHLLEEGTLYMEWKLLPGSRASGADANTLRVSSVIPSGDDTSVGRPSEKVTVRYGKIELTYSEGNIRAAYDASLS
ncbi:MAG: type VI secretion system tube protein Hcp [Lentisphaerota bacterium]